MILNKNTIESWNHSPLIGFRDQGRRCGGLQSQTTCVGVFFSWIGLVVLPKIAGSAAINSFNVQGIETTNKLWAQAAMQPMQENVEVAAICWPHMVSLKLNF